MRPPSHVEPVGLFGGAAEQGGLLVGGMASGDALKRMPQHRIAAGALIDREIALERRTLRAEGSEALPRLTLLLRPRRCIQLEPEDRRRD